MIYSWNIKMQENNVIGQTKTDPAPYLHVATVFNRKTGQVAWAIYVWDTREVIESGIANGMTDFPSDTKQFCSKVHDNKEPLKGRPDDAINLINSKVMTEDSIDYRGHGHSAATRDPKENY